MAGSSRGKMSPPDLAKRARRLDPLSLHAALNLGLAYRAAGRYDSAIEEFRGSLKKDPDSALAHSTSATLTSRRPQRQGQAHVWLERACLEHDVNLFTPAAPCWSAPAAIRSRFPRPVRPHRSRALILPKGCPTRRASMDAIFVDRPRGVPERPLVPICGRCAQKDGRVSMGLQ